MAKNLTNKQRVFISHYCKLLDAKSAAIKAGYSKKSAECIGSRLIKNCKVSAAIAKKLGKKCHDLDISPESVLNGIAQLAKFDVRKFFDANGNPKKIHELSDTEAAAVAGFEVIDITAKSGPQTTLRKFKLVDRGINLERLGRHLKLFTDRTEIAIADDLAERIDRARKRT